MGEIDYGQMAVAALQRVIDTDDPQHIYGDAGALVGIARPGVWGGEVEARLGQLPYRLACAVRRAAAAVAATERTRIEPPTHAVPVLVVHGETWWMREAAGGYLPVLPDLLVEELRREHPRLELPEGRVSRADVYRAVGGVTARSLRWVYGLDEVSWEAAERVLTLPGAGVRAGTAERHPDVEEWLEELTDQPTLLLDWLATAPLLDRPTAALQIADAPSSIGKAMLAAALGTWLGGTVAYSEATHESRSACLIRAPLVLLDEGAAESRPDGFRRLTGSREQQVRALYRMPETLVGCPRVLITSNEHDPLRLGVEELSSHSEEALGRRILLLRGRDEAREYLERRGGYALTRGWAEPEGALVQHLRWLAQERHVVHGARFLVEGDAEKWVASSHLREGLGRQVCVAWEAYADLLEDGQTQQLARTVFLPERERVGISLRGLQDCWHILVGDVRAPSHQSLAKVLRRLSGQEEAVRAGDPARTRVYWVSREVLE